VSYVKNDTKALDRVFGSTMKRTGRSGGKNQATSFVGLQGKQRAGFQPLFGLHLEERSVRSVR
jgi:hypothetical protein